MRTGCLVFGLLILMSAGMVSGQSTQTATQPSEESARLAAIKTAETVREAREMVPLKDLGAMKLADVVRVQVVDGRVWATTGVEPGTQGVRLSLAGLPGVVEMTAMGPRMAAVAGAGSGFTFLYQDVSRADNVMTTVQILSAAVMTQFNSTSDGLERTRSVALIEQGPPGPDAVSLRVDDTPSEWSDVATPAPANVMLNVAAGSFEQLRAQHRGDVDQYVRPMFRLLGQEPEVFAVDRSTAWLAMADAFVVDPAMRTKIQGIVPRLGADAFVVRDAASTELAGTGVEGAMTLAKMSLGTLSAEQRNRIDAFLRPYRTVDVKGLADDREFLMDCLYTDDTALRGVVMAKVSKVAGRTIQWKAVDTIGDRDLEIQTLRDELTGTSADAGIESRTKETGK